MNKSRQTDNPLKALMRKLLRLAIYINVIFNLGKRQKLSGPNVFYGGARSGNVGGPLVKVKRLKEFFPEHRLNFNLVYTLSNTPYLSEQALRHIKKKNIPLVLNQNGVFYPGWFGSNWATHNLTMSKAYHSADHVFWQSEFCRRSADKFLGTRNKPGEILYNAVDTERFCPLKQKQPGKPVTFLITGKIGQHLNYRLESTITALAEARNSGLDAKLLISGWIETPYLINEFAKSLGLTDFIHFSGPYTQEQAPFIYRSADIYVTMKYLDPCPNAVLEAMACGLPVLYSESGGTPELVGRAAGIGLSVPEDWYKIHVPSSQVICSGMMEIAKTHTKMGVYARRRATTQFDIKKWIDRHQTIFSSLLESSK